MTDTLADAVHHLSERLARSIGVQRRLWQCERCGLEVVALALEVGHHCESNRNRWVRFSVVETG